jgi:transposase-like protein
VSKKRCQHSAQFKAQVGPEALKGIEPVHAIAAKDGVHPVQVSQWKKEVTERLPEVFAGTLDASFCVRAVQRALTAHGTPEIFNTDQGCQFTSAKFTQPLLALDVKLSMDGQGR